MTNADRSRVRERVPGATEVRYALTPLGEAVLGGLSAAAGDPVRRGGGPGTGLDRR